MPQNLETIIGLEIHAQMNTATKMFCACDNDAFGKLPNTVVCPVCMGHPGTLPAPNAYAVKKAAKAALALNCAVATDSHFDRKNYFYPDLPAGFQISQYDFPLSKGGFVEFQSGCKSGNSAGVGIQTSKCRIARLHIENDAGKLMHVGGRSYCDFNRAGTPLMEIVTEPDLRSPADAVAFAKVLQRILVAVDVSEADMYKGMMRFDASISLRPKGEEKLYARSEIKNLNSFRSLEKALVFEEKRLRELWEKCVPQNQQVTVHWDDDKEIGVILREKESSADYRYFPEPDIPPLHFDEATLEAFRPDASILPEERRAKYLDEGLSEDQAAILVGFPRLADFYDAVVSGTKNHKRASSVVLTQLLGFLKAAGKDLSEGPSASSVIELLRSVDGGTVSANTAKDILEKMVATGRTAKEIIQEEGMQQISNERELESIVRRAIEANPRAVEDIRSGKEKATAAVIGWVMKETKGQADPTKVNMLLRELLKEQ